MLRHIGAVNYLAACLAAMTESSGRCFTEEQGLESEQGSDSKPRYKTNDREIEAQLICLLFVYVCMCVYVCVCVCVPIQTVCDKAVSWSQIVASSLLCWGDLAGTGYSDHGSCVCVCVCVYECLSQPCQISHDSAQRVCVRQGWPFSVCVPGNVCMRMCVYVCVCPVSASGRESPCLHCARELEGTPSSSVFGCVCLVVGVPPSRTDRGADPIFDYSAFIFIKQMLS